MEYPQKFICKRSNAASSNIQYDNIIILIIYFIRVTLTLLTQSLLGMRLICSKIYLLFLPELFKIFPYYSLKYIPPIIPKLFRSDSKKIIAIAN